MWPLRTESLWVIQCSLCYSVEDLLTELGISRHATVLETERITSATDLSLLSRDDCKELGFSIGERNRVADWAARAVRTSLCWVVCFTAIPLAFLTLGHNGRR
eukprot:COSAG02_NODE_3874_length_6107_cov_7.362350_3_plen_103_part_00